MLIHELLNKHPDMVPEEAPLIVLDSKSAMCMANILVGKIFQTLEEVQEHTLFSIKVGQLIMAHMFQYQLPNPVHIVSTIQHALQE